MNLHTTLVRLPLLCLGVLLTGMLLPGQGTSLRGAMVAPRPTPTDLQALRQTGANIIRLQFTNGALATPPTSTGVSAYAAQYASWLMSELGYTQQIVLPTCAQLGLQVCLDLHTPPGGRDPVTSVDTMFQAPWACALYLDACVALAATCGSHSAVWAFDLLNEPGTNSAPLWRAVAMEAATRVRRVVPNLKLVVESCYGDPCDLTKLQPLKMSSVVYSFHFYDPFAYTHQGVYGRPAPRYYHGTYRKVCSTAKVTWNKGEIQSGLRPVYDWAKQNGVRIFVGEFSANAAAPNVADYMGDCIQVFEGYGFQWCYHAWRESPIWNHEAGAAWPVIANAFSRN